MNDIAAFVIACLTVGGVFAWFHVELAAKAKAAVLAAEGKLEATKLDAEHTIHDLRTRLTSAENSLKKALEGK